MVTARTLAGAIALGAGELAVAVAGLPAPPFEQGGEGLADRGIFVVGEEHAPAGGGEVPGVDALGGPEVLDLRRRVQRPRLRAGLGIGLLAAGEGQHLLRGHRRQEVAAAGRVDAVEHEALVCLFRHLCLFATVGGRFGGVQGRRAGMGDFARRARGSRVGGGGVDFAPERGGLF